MSSDRPFYGLAHFQERTMVRVLDRPVLEEFSRTWKYHHKLELEQLEYGGRIARVKEVRMYHGGDILYLLEDVPGIWHQHLLERLA
jgi:hypothetical protein